MSTASIREALEAKKAEIEDALRELDRIEDLAGFTGPRAPEKSNSQAVLESISKKPKTLADIAEEVGLTKGQVYHALTSHRLRKIVRPVVLGVDRHFALKTWREGQRDDEVTSEPPTLTDAIVSLLAEHSGGPMKTVEVSNALLGKVDTTAKNFHGTVASTLSALVKSGRIQRVAGKGYALVQRKFF